MININPKQCKAARGLLDWSQEHLAKEINCSKKTITDFEQGNKAPQKGTITKIAEGFRKAGIFFKENNQECLVKLVKDKSLKSGNIRIAESNLVVTRSFLKGSKFYDVISDYAEADILSYEWNDRILDDLAASKIDLAVYNTNRAKKFINDRYLENIDILDHFCYSMGGENFYLIGKKDVWKETSLEEFRRNLKKQKEVKIIISRNNDNFDNLSFLVNVDDPNVKIINLPSDNIRKEIFEINPNILVCGSQNTRYNLLFQDDLIEVVNSSLISDKQVRNRMIGNSENSFLVNKNIYNSIPKTQLLELIKIAKENFELLLKDEKKINDLIGDLIESVSHITSSKENASFIIKNILYKTHRIGSPL